MKLSYYTALASVFNKHI